MLFPFKDTCGTKNGVFALLQSCLWATSTAAGCRFHTHKLKEENSFLLKIRYQ